MTALWLVIIVAISIRFILVESNGGIFWCDFDVNPRNTEKNRFIRTKKDYAIMQHDCENMTQLTSTLDTFKTFEGKLCQTISQKSYILERSILEKIVWRNYVNLSGIKVPFIYKDAYLLLLWAIQSLKPNQHSLWLEFGVFEGFSVNVTAFQKFRFKEPVYGFDSFQGVPMDRKTDHDINTTFPSDNYYRNGVLPNVRHNVKLIPGWFADTLPLFLSQHSTRNVSFVNIDNDLYTDTVDVLTKLLPKFEHQTLIHFHEFFRFHGETRTISGNSEMTALYDVMKINPSLKLQFIPVQGNFKEPAVFRVFL